MENENMKLKYWMDKARRFEALFEMQQDTIKNLLTVIESFQEKESKNITSYIEKVMMETKQTAYTSNKPDKSNSKAVKKSVRSKKSQNKSNDSIVTDDNKIIDREIIDLLLSVNLYPANIDK
jgi:Mg/Co/Ni transporter MgtE